LAKPLVNQEVSENKGLHGWRIRVECAGLAGRWFGSVSGFGQVDRERLKEVVDSGFERCMIRLPLTRDARLIGSASG
ncbi:hypothetical protein NA643_20480, partial [Pseudomonas stutzeri]|uniref:hypothetical protein n=1 Tax=Stutzerimonas stutzeri TaxID=316 RepID=UPI00210DF83E